MVQCGPSALKNLVWHRINWSVVKVLKIVSLNGDLHGTTLSHVTSLRQAYDMNCFV